MLKKLPDKALDGSKFNQGFAPTEYLDSAILDRRGGSEDALQLFRGFAGGEPPLKCLGLDGSIDRAVHATPATGEAAGSDPPRLYALMSPVVLVSSLRKY